MKVVMGWLEMGQLMQASESEAQETLALIAVISEGGEIRAICHWAPGMTSREGREVSARLHEAAGAINQEG